MANYPRKPRGGLDTLGDEHARRLSFCCAVDGCRSRATPPSVRFLGPKVYSGAVVILAAAMQHGPSKKRVAHLEVLLGIGRRTLVRWRRWWTEAFRLADSGGACVVVSSRGLTRQRRRSRCSRDSATSTTNCRP